MGRRILKRVQRSRSKDNRVQKKATATTNQHPLIELHRSIGSTAVQRLINSSYIQTKLQVNAPEDQLEDDAEKTSDAVMRSTDGANALGATSSSANNKAGGSASQNLQHRLATNSSSSSLPSAVREFMEPRLGADLSGVKVHTDRDAAEMSDQLHAQAFTHGEDIYFGAGKSPGKDALTAHELAHVVQQTGDGQPRGSLNRELISLNPDDEKKKREAKAAAIQAELQTLIDGAVWKEIRKRVYPKESEAGVKRAKERKEGKRPDLTGLGKITALERFATAIKKVQADWGKLSESDRVKAIAAATNAELTAAGVPPFLIVDKVTTEWKGYFTRFFWKFSINEALVKQASLSNSDAAELANTALHEARHAEQQFLAARYSAGPPDNKSAAAIALEQSIPEDPIAKAAVAAKFDAHTDPAVAALGKTMFKANVTEGAKNQQISDDDYTAEMKEARNKAITSLAALKAAATDANINDARTKCNTLKAAIAEVERRYTLYRNIPYEADAHEVGDAAEQAFKGWP